MLKTLSDAFGPCGCEAEVRNIIIEKVKPYADKMIIDVLGNLLVYKKGESAEKTLMLAAHMDEVGMILSGITDDGYLKFKTVGGIDPRVLVSKSVVIGAGKVSGVIALKAIHLQSANERKNAVRISDLRIDIGASSADDAKKYVQIGDYATFDTSCEPFGDGLWLGKAFDDRAGCAILCELVQAENLPYDTWFCFTVQEEAGCRGAAIAATRVNPTAALVIEGTTCSDVSGVAKAQEVTTLGGGAALSIADRGAYSDKGLTKKLYAAAEEAGIAVQYKRTTTGGNDLKSIQRSGDGVIATAVSVPTRYLHSSASVISDKDYKSVKAIAELFVLKAKELI